ncbi:MAG: vWA domain-containing protein [Promethearchaeota archaeon]
MSGNVSDKDLLKVEIIKGRKKPEYYEHLSQTLGFKDIKDMADLAIKYNNPKALISLMKTNLYAATSALSTDKGAEFLSKQEKSTQGNMLVEMFFMVRTAAPLKFRILMKQIARNVILRTSLKIAAKGQQKGLQRKRVPYYPGMPEFDLQLTIEKLLIQRKALYLSYQDIVGIRRTQVKKNVVLMLDTSGSMYGRALLNAALTTAISAYVLGTKIASYSIILFNSNSLIMKKMREESSVTAIIDQILDSEAVGFTNIEKALNSGLKELKGIKERKTQKFGILISDGNYNRGKNPVDIAKKYPKLQHHAKLHVVAMPPDKNELEGLLVCKEIAKAGNGRFYPVSNYHEIPRALLQILQKS